MNLKKYLAFIIVAATVSSCSEYTYVLKSDDYGRKLAMANDYYERGAVVDASGELNVSENTILRSVALYEQVYQRMPKTSEGELAYFRIGKAYYFAEDYYMSGYYLGVFPQRFPYSVKAEEAMFLSAMCGVQNSPDVKLDQIETELALNELQQFIDSYPESPLVDSCNNIIDNLRFKMETKAFSAVELYSKTRNYRAAVVSSLTFLEEYPLSSYTEKANYILVLNSFHLAINSVEKKKKQRIEDSMERYRNFVALYPESKLAKSLKGDYEEMGVLHGTYNNTENKQ